MKHGNALRDEFALWFCWAVGEHFVREGVRVSASGDRGGSLPEGETTDVGAPAHDDEVFGGGGDAGRSCHRRRYLDILSQTLTNAELGADGDASAIPPRDARLACAALTAMCKTACADWDSAPLVRGCLRRVLAAAGGSGTGGTGTARTGDEGTGTGSCAGTESHVPGQQSNGRGGSSSGPGGGSLQRWVYERAAEALVALESRQLATRCWSRCPLDAGDGGGGGEGGGGGGWGGA